MNYSSMSKWSKRPVLSMETQTESSLKFSIHEPKNNQNNENLSRSPRNNKQKSSRRIGSVLRDSQRIFSSDEENEKDKYEIPELDVKQKDQEIKDSKSTPKIEKEIESNSNEKEAQFNNNKINISNNENEKEAQSSSNNEEFIEKEIQSEKATLNSDKEKENILNHSDEETKKKPESSINNDGYSTENSRATTIESNVRMSYSQYSDEERPSDISSYSEKESEHDSNDVKSDEN